MLTVESLPMPCPNSVTSCPASLAVFAVTSPEAPAPDTVMVSIDSPDGMGGHVSYVLIIIYIYIIYIYNYTYTYTLVVRCKASIYKTVNSSRFTSASLFPFQSLRAVSTCLQQDSALECCAGIPLHSSTG